MYQTYQLLPRTGNTFYISFGLLLCLTHPGTVNYGLPLVPKIPNSTYVELILHYVEFNFTYVHFSSTYWKFISTYVN